MAKKKTNDVDLLLSRLDKDQLSDFIRKECAHDRKFQDRFIALGAGTVFRPDPETYAKRVLHLMGSYGGRYDYIDYEDAYCFNHDVSAILGEADDAVRNNQWAVAIAVLIGVASVAEEILNSGDDSDGELGDIVNICFEKWRKLCADEALPENFRSEIFEHALSCFIEEDLKDWDWRWDWIEIAISLADTPQKQSCVFEALDAIKPNGDSWSSRYEVNTAQNYKLELMSRCSSEEDRIKFMYDNLSNSDFRRKLIQIAWDNAGYEEVLRLAEDGVNHDSNYAGLVSDWNRWQYRVYRETGDCENALRLARHFFFTGGFGEKEFSVSSMYAAIKSLISSQEWPEYLETLINEAKDSRATHNLLHIYTAEKMWNEYMDYIRNNPFIREIDDAPKEVKKLFRDEIVELYSACVNRFFQRASDRKSYREGVDLLKNLIRYGGKKEAARIVAEQRSRTPRRPALIEELSKL